MLTMPSLSFSISQSLTETLMRWASRVGLAAPLVDAFNVGTEQAFALLQHSEGWLPFDRIRLVLVEEPSPDKPFDIPLLLDMCGGGFKLT